MSQSALDHTAPISDDVRWMCLPHVLLVCYLSCPDGIWQHHQRLCKALTSPPMPPVLHGAHTESKGRTSAVCKSCWEASAQRLPQPSCMEPSPTLSSPSVVQPGRRCQGNVNNGVWHLLTSACSC